MLLFLPVSTPNLELKPNWKPVNDSFPHKGLLEQTDSPTVVTGLDYRQSEYIVVGYCLFKLRQKEK
jgi:hypothetical protein